MRHSGMRTLNRLNGWQRLWLVLTILYGIVVALVTGALFPKEEHILSLWASEVIQVAVADLKRDTKYSGNTWDFRDAFLKEKTDEEIIRTITDGARGINFDDPKNADLVDYQTSILTI